MTYGEFIFWLVLYGLGIAVVIMGFVLLVRQRAQVWGYGERPSEVHADDEAQTTLTVIDAPADNQVYEIWQMPSAAPSVLDSPVLLAERIQAATDAQPENWRDQFPTPDQYRWLIRQGPQKLTQVIEHLEQGWTYRPWQLDEGGKPKKNEIPLPPWM